MLHHHRRPRHRPFLAAALAVAVLAPLACSDSGPTAGDGARVTVLLTDAPGDVVAAVVTIDQIYLTRGADADAEAPPAEGSSSRVVLRDEPMTVDLLTLAGAVDTVVTGMTIPAGSYGGLRLVVTGGYLEVENADGTTSFYASSPDYAGLPDDADVSGELHMPSWASSGLKVQLPGGLSVGDDTTATVLVDFDVAQSFGRQAGQSGRWVMSPVIKGTKQP